MKIETKFSVGDVVHFIDENRLRQAAVGEISILVLVHAGTSQTHINYKLIRPYRSRIDDNPIAEHLLFPTKEALVDNLYKQD